VTCSSRSTAISDSLTRITGEKESKPPMRSDTKESRDEKETLRTSRPPHDYYFTFLSLILVEINYSDEVFAKRRRKYSPYLRYAAIKLSSGSFGGSG
jgi:hypothetical protein